MIAPLTAGPEDLSRDRLFVTTPALWPGWPFLPVVRRARGKEDLGVVFDAPGAAGLSGLGATVFRTNLFLLPDTLTGFLALPREEYASAEDLLRDGWRVD